MESTQTIACEKGPDLAFGSDGARARRVCGRASAVSREQHSGAGGEQTERGRAAEASTLV